MCISKMNLPPKLSPRGASEIIILGPHDNLYLRKQAFRMKAMRMAPTKRPTIETGNDNVDETELREPSTVSSPKSPSDPTKRQRPTKKKPMGVPPPPPPEDKPSPSKKKTKIQKNSSGDKRVVKSSPKAATKTIPKEKCPANSSSRKQSKAATDAAKKSNSPSSSPSQSPSASPSTKTPRKRIIIVKDPNQPMASSSATTSSPRKSAAKSTTNATQSPPQPTTNPRSRPRRSIPNRAEDGKAPKKMSSTRKAEATCIKDNGKDSKVVKQKVETCKSKSPASNAGKEEKTGVFRAMRNKIFSRGSALSKQEEVVSIA